MINKRSLVTKVNKVVSGEESGSTPVVFIHGKKKLEFKSLGVENGKIVISLVPAKLIKEDKANEAESVVEESSK